MLREQYDSVFTQPNPTTYFMKISILIIFDFVVNKLVAVVCTYKYSHSQIEVVIVLLLSLTVLSELVAVVCTYKYFHSQVEVVIVLISTLTHNTK